MKDPITDLYRGWKISVKANDEMCANFSFEISNPDGYSQKVTMGGENIHRAVERAREMIDMEIALMEEE